MDKTKVDDMLIEMISPKVKEIEEKFTRGEGLTQDDINTLLLKSQYNHINHLDMKLDETVESVKELKNDFRLLETKVENDINGLRKDFNSLEERLDGKIDGLKKDFNSLEERLDSKINSLEERLDGKINSLEERLDGKINSLEERLDSKISSLEAKVDSKISSLEERIETTIQKALNRNMMLLIVVIGFFMTLSKIIDKF